MKIPAKILLLPVVSLMLVVGASSQADEALFSKSSQALEDLWSGVLGCHDAGDTQGFAPRDLYNSDSINIDASGNSGNSGSAGRRDYSECARQSLRNTTSRMLVNTIEDAVRSGGVALLEEQFRLDSSVSWVWDQDVRGEIDAVIPVWGKWHSDGTGSAFFMQPGAVLWNGIEGASRIDTNLGLVVRSYLDPDTAVGGSVFFDYDLERGHNRLGAGLDVQSGIVHAGVNYYHPLGGWRKGRSVFLDGAALSYEEQAQRGVDFRLGFRLLNRVYLDGAIGVWRFEGEREEVKSDWHSSYEISGRLRVYPGLFLEGGYESHDEKDSLGGRWNAGLTLSLLLPGLKGVEGSREGSRAKPNLWRLVEREKRILYEERLDIVPSVTDIRGSGGMSVEEGGTRSVTFEFDKPLEREVTVVFQATPRSTADPDEYTLSATTTVTLPETPGTSQAGQGPNVIVGGAQTNGEHGRLEMLLPRYTSSVTLTVTAVDDDLSEMDEIIELSATTTGTNARYARFTGLLQITIPRNDDFHIGFAEPSSRVEEGDNAAVTTRLQLRLGRPAPAGGVPISVSATSGDPSVDISSDITFTSPTILTVPEGTNEGLVPLAVASVEVIINADTDGEGPEQVVFTIMEGANFPDLPDQPWRLEPGATTHTLTIGANDNDIGFAALDSTNGVNLASYDEADGVVATRTVEITGVAAPAGGIPLTWTATSGDTPPVDISGDISAVRGSFSIPAGQTSATFDVGIVNDDIAELSESIRLTISGDANLPSSGYRIASPTNSFSINPNDNTVQFASAGSTLEETDDTVGITVPVNVNFPYAVGDIQVGLAVTGSAGSGEYTIDIPGTGSYSPGSSGSPGILTIPQGTSAVNIRVRSQGADGQPELAENIIFTLSERSSPDQLPDGWMLGARTVHTVTIPENEQPRGSIGFERTTSSANEGDPVTLVVTSSNPADENLLLTWTVTTGAADVDDPDTGTVTISNGSSRGEFSFTIQNDADPEDSEDVVVTLSRHSSLPMAWLLNSSSTTHTITIPANDRLVSFTPDSATETEVTGTGQYDLALDLNDPAPAGGLPLLITKASGSDPNNELTLSAPNSAEASWNAGSNTFTIAAGQTTATLRMTFAEDTGFETDIYTLNFAGGANFPSADGWEIANRRFVLTVEDPEPNMVQFAPTDIANSINLTSVDEGDNLSLTVVVSGGNPDTALNFTWSVTDNDNDITDPDNGTLSIPTTTDRVSFNIPIRDDGVDMELPESFTVRLGGSTLPQGYDFGDNRDHEFVINANGNTVTFAGPSPASPIPEGMSATITATIDKAIPVNTTSSDRAVAIALTGNAVRGTDYSLSVSDGSLSGNTWTLPTGADSGAETREAVLTIEALDTPTVTTDRSLTIEIAGSGTTLPTGWTETSVSHNITLTNDDFPTVGFAGAASSVAEGATSYLIPFHIVNSGSFGSNFDVTITATGDIGGSILASNTVAINGLTNQGWTIMTIPDNQLADGNKTVMLTLTAVSDNGWRVNNDRSTHTLTITDDDVQTGTIEFATTTPTEAIEDPNGDMTYTVNINVSGLAAPAPANAFTLPVVATGTATPATDYTVSPLLNAVSVSTTTVNNGVLGLEFTIINDSDREGPETIILTLQEPSPTEWNLGTNTTHTINIPLNDAPVGFAVNGTDTEATEGASTSGSANPSRHADVFIDIDRAGSGAPSDFDLNVVATGNFEAGDYTTRVIDPVGEDLNDNVIRVPSGTTQVSFVVTAQDDTDIEDETITFALSGTLPSGFVFADDMHTITIKDKGRVVAFANATAAATEEAASVQTQLTITPAPTAQITIPVTITSDETDYTLTAGGTSITGNSGNVTFNANQGTVALVLQATNDTDTTGGTVTVAIDSGNLANGYVEGDTDSWAVTINDNDSTISTVGFVADGITVPETPVMVQPRQGIQPPSTRRSEDGTGNLIIAIAAKLPDGSPVPNGNFPEDGLPVTITSSDTAGDDITVMGGSEFDLVMQLDTDLGEGIATIEVDIDDDSIPEDTEVFTLTMSPDTGFPSNYEIAEGGGNFEITILPSDNTIGFASPTETIHEDAGTHEVKVVLSSPASSGALQDGILVSLMSGDASIIQPTRGPSYEIEADDEETPQDESMQSDTVYLIPSGVREYVLPVTVHSGAVSGASEDVILTLTLEGDNNPSDWNTSGPVMQTLTVQGAAGMVSFANSSVSLKEGEGAGLVISLSRPAPPGGLNFFLSDADNQTDLIVGNQLSDGFSPTFTPYGTGGAGVLSTCPDGGCGIVHVPAGEDEVVIPVIAYDDDAAEGEEEHVLTISSVPHRLDGTSITPELPSGWTFGSGGISAANAAATVTIAASDNIIRWSSEGVTLVEGVGQTGFNLFTPSPDNLPSGGLTLPVSVVPSGELTFIAGVTNGEIVVMNDSTRGRTRLNFSALSDDVREVEETVVIAIDESALPEGWSFAPQGTRNDAVGREPYNEAHVTVTDTSGTIGVVGFEEDESTIIEGGSGNDIQVKLTSTLPAPAGGFTLNITPTVDGTTNPGTDGAITVSDATSGVANVATFAAQQNEATINISAADDSVVDVTDVSLAITSDLSTIPAISTWVLGRDTHLAHIQDATEENLINVAARVRTASEGDSFDIVLDIPEKDILSSSDGHNFAVSLSIDRCDSNPSGDVCVSSPSTNLLTQTDLRDQPNDKNKDAVFTVNVIDDDDAEGVEEVDITFQLTRVNRDPNPIMPDGWTPGVLVTTLRIEGSDQTVGFADRTAELDLSDSTALTLPVTLSNNAPSTHTLDPDGTPDSGDEFEVGGLRLLVTANHPKIVFDNSSLPAYQRGFLSPQQTIMTVPGGVTSTDISVPFNADDFDGGDTQIVRFSMAPVNSRFYYGDPDERGGPEGLYPGWEIGNDVTDVTILPPRTIGFSTYYSRVAEGGTSQIAVVLSRPAPSGGLTAKIASNNTEVLKFGTTAGGADTFDAVFSEGSTGPVMVNVFAVDDPPELSTTGAPVEPGEVGIPVNAGNSVDLTVTELPSGWSQAKPQPYGIASIYALHSVFIDDNDTKTAGWELTESEVTEGGSVTLRVDISKAAPSPPNDISFFANVRSRKQGLDTRFDGNGVNFQFVPTAGNNFATVDIPIMNDTDVQGTRYLDVTLSFNRIPDGEWTINPLRETLLLKVLDDDGHTVSIDTSMSTSTSFEGDPDAKLVLSLSGPAPAGNRGAGVVPGSFCVKNDNGVCVYPTYTGGLGVTIHSSDIADAHTNPLTVIIPEGRTTHEVPLSVLRDTVVEPNGSTVEFRLGLNIGHTRTSDG
ncbi:MAG: inverse autotransporter beta domain-containing protein, partial [Hyphomicrobiales bacterium]|nr:inverse autotransporter beta domain-containing protein [Hyphomicrobiales bacterium]